MNPTAYDFAQLAVRMDTPDLPDFLQLPSANPRPSREAVHKIAERLQALLFPGYFEPNEESLISYPEKLEHGLAWVFEQLLEQVRRDLCFRQKVPLHDSCAVRAKDKVCQFLETLPRLRRLLALDAQAAYHGDPAAESPEETIFCYPGMTAITFHRLAHELYRLEVPLLARIIGEQAHSLTGIDIHPGATIGESFFIDHGTGVVIGETCVIGNHVRLYQGVTLGARSFPVDSAGHPIKGTLRHPIIEDDVVVYAGATVLGRITVGRGSRIGGNVWLTESVPPRSKIAQHKASHDRFEEGAGI